MAEAAPTYSLPQPTLITRHTPPRHCCTHLQILALWFSPHIALRAQYITAAITDESWKQKKLNRPIVQQRWCQTQASRGSHCWFKVLSLLHRQILMGLLREYKLRPRHRGTCAKPPSLETEATLREPPSVLKSIKLWIIQQVQEFLMITAEIWNRNESLSQVKVFFLSLFQEYLSIF